MLYKIVVCCKPCLQGLVDILETVVTFKTGADGNIGSHFAGNSGGVMRTIIVPILLAWLSMSGSAQRLDLAIEVDGVNRTFVVSIPSGTAPANGYPLVVMLHGTSGDGERFYNISGWKEVGEVNTFISVFPSSLEWCVQDEEDPNPHRTTKWVNGDLLSKACAGQTFVDDVKFLSVLVDTIKSRIPINNRMVFISGFSNGGVMTSKMALDAPNVFRAIAPCSGFITDLDSAIADKPTPTWFCVGTKDVKFTEPRGLTELPFNDSSYYWMRGTITKFLAAYQLKEEYEKDSTDGMISWTFTTPMDGKPASFLRFTLVKNLDHTYANGENFPLKYAPMFWKFFTLVASNTDVSEARHIEHVSSLQLTPNPASDVVNVAGEWSNQSSASTYQIVDNVGNVVSQGAIGSVQSIIPTSHLPAGSYIVIIGTTAAQLQIVR